MVIIESIRHTNKKEKVRQNKMNIDDLIAKLKEIRDNEGNLEIWVEVDDFYNGYYLSTWLSMGEYYKNIHAGYIFENDTYPITDRNMKNKREVRSGEEWTEEQARIWDKELTDENKKLIISI